MRPDDYLVLRERLHCPPPQRVTPIGVLRGEKLEEDAEYPAPVDLIQDARRLDCLSDELLVHSVWSALSYSYGVLDGPPPDVHALIATLKELEIRCSWRQSAQGSVDLRATAIGVLVLLAGLCGRRDCVPGDFLRRWWRIVRSRFAFRDTRATRLEAPPASSLDRSTAQRRKWRQVVFNGRTDEAPACAAPTRRHSVQAGVP